ncbi:Protein of unknown function [Bacillus mycoides]|uniref:Uncharacterized protein n=1 Tax=Bacillus mycoides TaxID=1405 RepID=A0A1C4DFF4_BACMY|nr:Protein of unknown function [Bacillus mycoides]SCC30115.1 Protein of unknown function [Bacillus mycoides]SCM87033.1 Protein of unknown function [Bacillus mycoides]
MNFNKKATEIVERRARTTNFGVFLSSFCLIVNHLHNNSPAKPKV